MSEHNNSSQDWLLAAEAIAELRTSKSTLHRWIRAGELPAVRVGNTVRIRRCDLEAFMRPAARGAE
jgi:excisionase family DNA binding protein